MSSNMERVAAMPDASLYVNRDGRRADDCVDSHGGGNLTKIPRSDCKKLAQNLTLDLESNFEKLRKTRIFGFFSILQFLVSALEIPSRFRFRSGSLDFSSFGTMDLLVRRRPEEKFDFQNLTTIRNGLSRAKILAIRSSGSLERTERPPRSFPN